MKKLTLGLAVVFSGIMANSYAGSMNCIPPCAVSVPTFCGGLMFGVTGFYWRSSDSNDDYALVTGSNLNDDEFHRLNPHYDFGYGVNVGYRFPCSGNDAVLAYTHFDQDQSDETDGPLIPTLTNDSSLSVPVGPITVVSIPGATVITPGLPFAILPLTNLTIPTVFQSASAKSDIKNDVLDLEFGQNLLIGNNFKMRYFGGLRYARIKNDVEVTYTGVGMNALVANEDLAVTVAVEGESISGIVSVSTATAAAIHFQDIVDDDSRAEGVGPRLGMSGSYYIGAGVSIVGATSTSLLVSEVQSSFNLQQKIDSTIISTSDVSVLGELIGNILPGSVLLSGVAPSSNTTTPQLHLQGPDKTRIIPNLEAKLGLNYSYGFAGGHQVTLEGGYKVNYYWNAVDRSFFDGSTVGITNISNMSFSGPYASLQLTL